MQVVVQATSEIPVAELIQEQCAVTDFVNAHGIARDSSVFSTHMKTLTISGQVFGSLLIVSSPMASACVPAASTGCEYLIPRPYGLVQRRGPGALYKYWAQERGPHFGRDQFDNFSGIGRDQIDNFSHILVEISS